MGRDLIVDGYNVLLRWRRGGIKRGPGNIERARDALVAWVARRVDNPTDVTLVFDAQKGSRAGLVESRRDGVRVLFAEGLASADDWIARECDARRHDKSMLVVSNDRAVQLAAKQARVEYLSADEWIANLTSFGRREGIVDDPEPASPLPRTLPPATLSGSDLDEFREAMQQPEKAKPLPTKESSRVADPPSMPGKPEPPRSAGDLQSFYETMRDWKDDDPPPSKPIKPR
ncbi:NYN domain-containing protein [bacterium]|jgi:predicted RNA-binding protein with PIN domain|nr:NYN domain-containing protein [bacterium]